MDEAERRQRYQYLLERDVVIVERQSHKEEGERSSLGRSARYEGVGGAEGEDHSDRKCFSAAIRAFREKYTDCALRNDWGSRCDKLA